MIFMKNVFWKMRKPKNDMIPGSKGHVFHAHMKSMRLGPANFCDYREM